MAIQVPAASDAVIEAGVLLSNEGAKWQIGFSKRSGQTFYIIPSRTEPGKVFWTTEYGCTCRGFRRYMYCAHSVAVRQYNRKSYSVSRLIGRRGHIWNKRSV